MFLAVFGQAPPSPACRGRVSGCRGPAREGSGEHPEHLLGGDHQQAEGQVRGHLDRAAHPDVPSAVLVVQVAVDPLDGRALVVAPRLCRGEFDLFSPARIVVNDGHVPQPCGHLADLFGVVSGVGQVIEVGDASGGHLRQGDGSLAVMQAGGAEDETDGDVAVDHVQMGLVTAPAFDLVMAVFLAAPVANLGQTGQIPLQTALELPLQPRGVRWRGGGIVLAAAAALAAPGLGRRLRFGLGPLAGVDGGGVPADVPGELVAIVGFDQRLVNLLRTPVAGKDAEGAREGCLRRDIAERLPAAQAAQRRAVADRVEQVAGRGEVPDGLGDEGLAQGQAVAGRAAVAAPAVDGHVVLRGAQFANRDELAVPLVEFADLVFQCGDQPSLDADPQTAECVNGVCLRHGLCLPCFFSPGSCLSMRQTHHNTLPRNSIQLFSGGVDKLDEKCDNSTVRFGRGKVLRRKRAARSEGSACPGWGSMTLQKCKTPRQASRQAQLDGGFCKSLRCLL